jgi:hypothetical protein
MKKPGRWGNESLRDRMKTLQAENKQLMRIALKLKRDLMASLPVTDGLQARTKIMQSVVEMLSDSDNWRTIQVAGKEVVTWAGPSLPQKIAEEAIEDAERAGKEIARRHTTRRIVRPE